MNSAKKNQLSVGSRVATVSGTKQTGTVYAFKPSDFFSPSNDLALVVFDSGALACFHVSRMGDGGDLICLDDVASESSMASAIFKAAMLESNRILAA